MAAIRCEGLCRRFGETTAVEGLTLEVGAGELFGLVGPDGAGKTTTLRLLASIMEPTGGEAFVGGFSVSSQAEEVKGIIGYMSQRFGLYPDLSVIENIRFYADIYSISKKEREERIPRLLAFSNLAEFQKRRAADLSGGMKQKLGLCCALIHTPKILLLDEPTNGVDPVSRRDFWRILQTLLREGVTIFLATSYLDEAERCARIGLISGGKLLAAGTPAEVKGLFEGEIISALVQNPRESVFALSKEWKRGDVSIFGERLHLSSEEKESLGAAKEAMGAAGVEFSEIGVVEPTLEDVFLSVLGKKGAGDYWATASASKAASGGVTVAVENLTKRFGEFTAVDNVSFEVRAGEIFGFLGPNGAGKSTTIRMLCGLLSPTSGGGRVAGFEIASQAELIKSSIGYMSQKFSLYGGLTVEENMDFFAGIYAIPQNRKKERKEWVAQMAGLADLRERKADSLAAGQKQRLALGCAVMHEPPILFLDEPTSGVDPVSRRRFWNLIHSMAGRGVTVFVTTHYMDEAEYCGRLGMIYRGKLVALASPDLLRREKMRGEVMEITCRDPAEALEVVEVVNGVREAALFGAKIHAVAESFSQTSPLVFETLSQRGFSPLSPARISPSLEDVFVSLITGDEGRRG